MNSIDAPTRETRCVELIVEAHRDSQREKERGRGGLPLLERDRESLERD